MRGLGDVALAFHEACSGSGVRYCFVGALAVMAWGEPRATTDADALAEVPEDAIPVLVRALSSRGLRVDERDLLEASKDGSHATIFADDSAFYIDLKPARTREERAEVAGAVEVPFGGGALRVVGPEETIAFKLLFGSPKDVQDARSIYVRQREALDRGKLAALAIRLKVEPAYRKLQQEVEGA